MEYSEIEIMPKGEHDKDVILKEIQDQIKLGLDFILQRGRFSGAIFQRQWTRQSLMINRLCNYSLCFNTAMYVLVAMNLQ